MQLILAIDSDPRRSEQLAAVVRAKLTVDLVQATSAGEGLHALRDRVPDLILTSPLLSPFDDGVLDEYLRDLGAAATHVQTLRIPVLSASPKRKSAARSLFSLGRKKPKTSSAAPDGCDPKVFADEIAHYLTRSLEERSALAKVGSLSDPTETALADGSPLANHPTDRSAARTPAQARPAQIQPDSIREELVPEAPIEEFTQPVYEPEPVYVPVYEPEPVYQPRAVEHAKPVEDIASVTAAPVVVEEMLVPGSILGLRSKPKVIVVPEPKVVVEPELPTIVEPELQAIVRPEPPPIVEPELQAIVQPELQAIVQPEPPAIVEPERPAIVKPVAASQPEMVSRPAPTPATATGTSPSFEAALAAIRAAWVKPEAKKNVAAEPVTSAHQPPVSPSNAPVTGSPKPLAGSGEVDLTNEIDALEDVVGVDGTAPGTDDEPSPDESKTPSDRRKVDKSKKRPEKARGRKMRGPDGRDDLGVFDPNQCGFSALVNKLDEVTEDEVTGRTTTTVR